MQTLTAIPSDTSIMTASLIESSDREKVLLSWIDTWMFGQSIAALTGEVPMMCPHVYRLPLSHVVSVFDDGWLENIRIGYHNSCECSLNARIQNASKLKSLDAIDRGSSSGSWSCTKTVKLVSS
jgi:hypothetical protein